MNKIRVVGIDIAKSVFQVCVWMIDDSVARNRKISRQKLLDTLRQLEPGTLIAMEACSTSHGRETKVVLSDKKWQSQPENISYPWCTVSDALRKKA